MEHDISIEAFYLQRKYDIIEAHVIYVYKMEFAR